MDKRQTHGPARAILGGPFSSRSTATPPRPYSEIRKAHTVCAFAIALAAAPLAALAADSETTQTVRLDVVGGGALAAFLGGLSQYLIGRNRTQRQPPLGEDVARTYATKDELAKCQGVCRKDMDSMREKIDETDRKAEDRSRGTHARIDRLYVEQQKNNKALGMLIGIMVGKGIAPSAAAANITTED